MPISEFMPFASPAIQLPQFVNAFLVTGDGRMDELYDYRKHEETGCIFKYRALVSLVGAIDQCARRMTIKACIAEMQRRVAEMIFGEHRKKKHEEKAFVMTKSIMAHALPLISD